MFWFGLPCRRPAVPCASRHLTTASRSGYPAPAGRLVNPAPSARPGPGPTLTLTHARVPLLRLPARCSYQLCLFCYQRLQNEFNNQCPGCRQPYDSDFDAGLRRRQERAEREQAEDRAAEVSSRPPPVPAATVKLAQPRKRGQQPQPLPQAEHDLHIEEEQVWPSLGGVSAAMPPGAGAAASGRRPLPRVATTRVERVEPESSSTTSSGTTTATTPQSPADSVVAYRAALPTAAQAAAAVEALRGHCHVALQTGGLGAQLDPEGANLCASLQGAVKLGTIGIKQAASTLASYLRRKHQQQLLGAHGSLPYPCPDQGAASPFQAAGCGLLSLASPGEALEACQSLAASEEPSLRRWGSGASAQASASGPAALEGASGSPVRGGGRLPLYARGSGAATAGSQPGSGFPGFPAALASPAQDPPLTLGSLKGRLAPPGFGTSFQSLPRFKA